MQISFLPVEFSSPLLVASTRKVNGAASEVAMVEKFAARGGLESSDPTEAWGAMTAIAASVHNVYNGIEDVLKDICKNVDGIVPAGPSWHKDILAQLSSPLVGTRPAILDDELYSEMMILRGFRHVVNHNYALVLDPVRVAENLERTKRVFPKFRDALMELDRHLSADPSSEHDEPN